MCRNASELYVAPVDPANGGIVRRFRVGKSVFDNLEIWVISAVFPKMIEAEQYFSFDSSMAGDDISLELFSAYAKVKVNSSEDLGIGFSALCM